MITLSRPLLIGAALVAALGGGTATGPASNFVPMSACTAVDTRTFGPIGANTTVQVNFTYADGLGGDPSCLVPSNATAVQATLLAFNPAGTGYLSAWPTGTTETGASLLEYIKATNAAGGATLALNQGGATVRVNSSATNFGINVEGYYLPAPPVPAPLTASVSYNGTLRFGSHVTSTRAASSPTYYVVTFDRDVTHCTYQATARAVGDPATVKAYSRVPYGGTAQEVEVDLYVGYSLYSGDFDLTVTCF